MPIPSDYANLTAWIDPALGVTLDGSSRVQEIIDQANGIVFSQGTAGSRPAITAAAINGLPALSSDTTPRFLRSTTPQSTTNDLTIAAVYRVTAGTAGHIFSKGDSLTQNEFYHFTSGGSLIFACSFDVIGGFQHTVQGVSWAGLSHSTYKIYLIRRRGMHLDLWVNGVKVSPTSGPSVTKINVLDDPYTLLGQHVTGSTSTDLAELCFYSRALPATELTGLNDYFATKFAISSTFTGDDSYLGGVVFRGDSQTVGVLGVAPCRRSMDNPTGLNTPPPRVWDYANDGIAGQTTRQYDEDFNTEVAPFLRNGDVLVIWGGSNDFVLEGRTAAQVIASLDSIVVKARAAATVRIVGQTILNRSAFTATMGSQTGAESGYQATVNQHIRNTMDTNAVADTASIPELQNSFDTTYYSDGSHPTVAGDNLISDEVLTPALLDAISGDPPTITTEPTNASYSAGDTFRLRVIATGEAPLTYQWRKGGVNITGATSSELVFNPAAVSDTGSYDVVVSNGSGSDTSVTVTVTVSAVVPPGASSFPGGGGGTVSGPPGSNSSTPASEVEAMNMREVRRATNLFTTMTADE